MKKIPLFVTVLIWVIAVIAVAAVAFFALWNYEISPVSQDPECQTVEFRIPAGTSTKNAAKQLENLGIIHSSIAFYAVCRFNVFDRNSSFKLKSGMYNVSPSMSMEQLYFLLQEGSPEYITVHIPEGLTISKIGKILEDNRVCNADAFIAACHNSEIAASYSIPAESVEGFLFPDTYCFTPDEDPEVLIDTMVKNFRNRIKGIEGIHDFSEQELYDTVILASIVEREYKVPSEAPLIASVFSNRLKYHAGLGSCATIEYILTEIEGRPHPDRILNSDLKIDNPYNTYMWAGLPPGPISNPGLVALEAAVHPAKTDYWYFVLTDPEKGSHTFTTTLEDHRAAANTSLISK